MHRMHERLLTIAVAACALTLCAGPVFAAFTVEITVPDMDPCLILVDYEYDFEAIAYLDGEQLPGGEVTWSWDFGDNSDPSTDNPTVHTYENTGTFIVTVTGTYSGQQAQDTTTMQVQTSGGVPYWVKPLPNDTVGALVELRVYTTRGDQWMVQDVRFYCQEQAQGGHERGPWEECDYGAAYPMAGDSGTWWAQWLPQNNSWGHNGKWKLRAEVDYFRWMPPNPPEYETLPVPVIPINVLDIVIHATSTAPAPGLPDDADVLAIDPTATGTPYEKPKIQWEVLSVHPASEFAIFRIEIKDLVTGDAVKVVDKSDIPNWGKVGEWEWDGSKDGGGTAYGFYGYVLEAGLTLDGYRTGSQYLDIEDVEAAPGLYSPTTEKLPFTVRYELSDSSGLDASYGRVYLYNASKDNTGQNRFPVVDSRAMTDRTCGEHEIEWDIDPLDGTPYYFLFFARDDHGDRKTDGDREHINQPVFCRAVELTYSVTDVFPDDGRVYISDTLGRYPDVPELYEDDRKCQTSDQEATIQAHTTLSSIDILPDNDETTMDRPYGGVTVYFTVNDPDSRTLWDKNGDDPDDNDDAAGEVEPESVVAVPQTVTHGGSLKVRGIAETTLTITDRYSGDNYYVEASPYDQPVTSFVPPVSGDLEAWKMVYYERDSMFVSGQFLTQDAAEDADVIHVENAMMFAIGEHVMVFDGDHHANNGSQEHTVTDRDWFAGTITISPDLPHAYAVSKAAAVGSLDGGFRSTIKTGLLAAAYGDAKGFVRFDQYPNEAAGVFPKCVEFGAEPIHYTALGLFFDHAGEDNVMHYIDAETDDDGAVGLCVSKKHVLVYVDADTDDKKREVLVHETGHVFGMSDFVNGHPDHPNWDALSPYGTEPGTVPPIPNYKNGCIMLYRTGPPQGPGQPPAPPPFYYDKYGDGYAQFGGGPPVPNAQPIDLKDGVAGQVDPLPFTKIPWLSIEETLTR